MVALAHYPNRQAFADMIRDPVRCEVAHLRSAALVLRSAAPAAVPQPTSPIGG